MKEFSPSQLDNTSKKLESQVTELFKQDLPDSIYKSTQQRFTSIISRNIESSETLIRSLADSFPNWTSIQSALEFVNSGSWQATKHTIHQLMSGGQSINVSQKSSDILTMLATSESDIQAKIADTAIASDTVNIYVKYLEQISYRRFKYAETAECTKLLTDWFKLRFVVHRNLNIPCKLTEIHTWINIIVLCYAKSLHDTEFRKILMDSVDAWADGLNKSPDFRYALPKVIAINIINMNELYTPTGVLLMIDLYNNGFSALDNHTLLSKYHTNSQLSIAFNSKKCITKDRPDLSQFYLTYKQHLETDSLESLYIEHGLTILSEEG